MKAPLVKRHLTSIVFIAAALLVSTYAYFVDRHKVTDSERTARGAALFPAFRRDEIRRIELAGPQESLVLERDMRGDGRERTDGGDDGEPAWRMLSPVSAAADPAATEALLGALDVGNVIRRAEGQNFDTPRVRGTILMGKVVYRFALGNDAPVPDGAAYLQLDGEGAYVVGRDLVTQLLKPADAYRERTIVPYLSIALRRLEVRGPTKSWAIDRTDEVSFHFGDGARVSRDGIDRVWRALAETRAEVFISNADADSGQAAALKVGPGEAGASGSIFTVTMTPKDDAKAPGELAIGGVCPGHPEDVIAVRRTPTRLSACVPKMVLDGLGTPKADLLDKRLFAARFDEVEELILEATPSGSKLEIARLGSGWHERSPEDRELSKDEVEMANALVTQLVRGEGRPLDPTKESTAFAPSLRVVIGRAESEVREEIRVDRTPKPRVPSAISPADEFLVRRTSDGAMLVIERDLERKLEPRATALRGRELWSHFPLEGKEALSVATRCARGVDQELVREGTTFVMRKPAGYPADNGAALDVFEAVAHAKAESWVADADDGTFGLANGCRVEVGVKDDGGTRTEALLLGREAESGVFAQVAGHAPIFIAPKALADMLARPLVDRNAFFIDPPKLAAVTVKRGAGAPTALNASLFPIFARLRAEEVLHLGAARPDEGFATPALEVRATLTADAGARTVRFLLGRATLLHDQKVCFARIDGIDATFTIVKERIEPLLDGLDTP